MAIISFNADSTSLILNDTPINDFIEGDYIEFAPVNPLTSRINGDKDALNVTKRIDGNVYDLTIRVIRFSDSDIFLNGIINSKEIVIISGSLKESFTRDGSQAGETWILNGGTITDQPTEAKNNQDGNATMEYKIQFRTAIRNI